jgi:phosphomannomutase
MALKGREDLDPLMRTVVLARDARKIEPEIIEAIAAALLVAGFQVIYIGGKRPNSAASFEWALREYRPLLGIFVTTNHQRDSEEAKIRGARVSLQDEEGRIRNLTREQIRESLSLLGAHLTQGFMRNKERLIQDFETTSPGRIIEESVDLNSVRANVLIGLVAGGSTPKTLYDLARELEDPGKPALEVLSEWERTAGDEKPLAGLKIAIDGAHTPSGPLAQKTFEGLGAEVELVHAEVKEILETDRADPSQEGNLIPLKKRMQEKGIQLGLAFDINGDRGDLILRTGENQFVRILADNLTQVLIPYLLREGGYDPRKIGPVAVIRDILSSRGVDEVARRNRLSVHITDSGYVFLNEKANQLRKEGIIPLIRVERSGHLWLDVLGDFENPIVVATLFALASLRHQKENRESTNPFSEIYLKGVVSHRQSARFQLPFHPKFLKELSSDPRNTNGYAYEPGARPSQNLIALGRHVAVEKALQFLDRNKLFVTPAGLLKVGQIETQKDVADNLFRYLVVPFFNGREDYVGRFVLRASANEPAFVVSFETPVRREKGETPEAEFIQDRYTAVGGIVLDFLEGAEFAEVSGEAGTTLSTYRRSVRRSEARAGTPAERLPRRLARGLLRSEVRIVASVYKNRILPTWEAYSPGVRRLAVRLFLGPEVLAATGVLSPSLPRLSPEEISSLGPVQPMLSASSQTKRRIFDYRSLPDRPETLDSVLLYALYHREVGYKLLAVASPEQVRNLMNEVRRYVESRYRTSLPPNFQIIALPSPEALIPTLHDLVSEANTPAGFISEEGKVAAKIAYRRGLLRVAGSSDPSVQNATALLAAERLQGDLPFAFYLHVLTGRDLDLKNRWDELVAFLRAREALLRAA